jgi:uncharacterized protein involved in outer membrane biogenesis
LAINLRRYRRAAGILVLVYAVYALLVLFVLPPVARHQIQKRVGEALQRRVVVDDFYVNPFTFFVRVRGVDIWEPDGKGLFAGVSRFEANLEPLPSAWHRGLVVKEVLVDTAYATVARRPDGLFNFSDLVKPRPAPEPSSGPFRFSVADLQIRESWFVFRDELVGETQSLTSVNFSLAAFSSLPEHVEMPALPAFRARLNGRELVLDAEAKPFAKAPEGGATLTLRALDLARFARYLPEPRNFDLASGLLDLDLVVSGKQAADAASVSVSGELGLREFQLLGRDGQPLAGVDELRITVLPTDLMQREIHVGSVVCTAPFLRLDRTADGVLVLPQAGGGKAADTEASPEEPLPAGPAVTVEVDDIAVQDGKVAFADATVNPPFQSRLGFQVGVKGLTTRPEQPVQVHIQVATESEETVEGTYVVTLFPTFSLTGTTAVEGVKLPKYMPYLDQTLAATIASGTVGLNAAHAVRLPTGSAPEVKVTDLDLRVADFRLSAADEPASPVVQIPELTVTDAAADLGSREATVGTFATRGGEMRVRRFKDGSLNLQKLTRAASSTPAAAPAATPAPPWTFTLREASIAGWGVDFVDQQPAAPVRLAVRDIAVNVGNLTTRENQKSSLSLGLRLNEAATLAVAGDFCLRPASVAVDVKLDKLALKDFQNYLAEHLNLLVSDGTLETDLRVDLAAAPGGGVAGTVGGMTALRSFVSLDSASSADFVKCGELALRGIRVDLNPLAVRLDEVALAGLVTAITVGPDGTVNLMSVVGKEPAAAPAEAAAEPGGAFPLEIGTIRLEGCGLVFTDQQVVPHYRLGLGDLSGTITAFSLGKPTPAQIDLSARLDGHSPFALQATLADLGPQMTLSATTTLKNFGLSPVTPYSGRYVGYAVQKGQLSLDLAYTVKERQLAAEHKVLIDQFAFGQRIESPDATDLPVRLAVALLKDRKGQIILDVPVHGSLDDPEFSVLRIVLKVVRDLVAKAATAPFGMLGALVGGGEELSFVDFAPGSAELDETGVKKLGLLAKALAERPELGVEIGGTVDAAGDREALARRGLQRQLQARKLAELVKSGAPSVPVDEISLSEPEREALLLAIYREALVSTPKEPAARPPEPSPAEIEQQLLAKIVVSDEEVNLLGGQRASRVREFLTTTGEIAPERVFVVGTTPGGGGERQARMSLR